MSIYEPDEISIDWHDELPSTNTAALERFLQGEADAVWIAAKRQTAGRGRSGRAWSDIDGNLAATLLLPLRGPSEYRAQLSFVAGVSVIEAIRRFKTATGSIVPARLKWPNDAVIDGRKCAGLLVESTSRGELASAAIGFGVNLQAAPRIDGRQTTALADHGLRLTPEEFLRELSRSFAASLAIWDNGYGFPELRSHWMRLSVSLGTPMTTHDGGRPIRGQFAGVEADGALRLQLADGSFRRLIAGDVEIASPKHSASMPATGTKE